MDFTVFEKFQKQFLVGMLNSAHVKSSWLRISSSACWNKSMGFIRYSNSNGVL